MVMTSLRITIFNNKRIKMYFAMLFNSNRKFKEFLPEYAMFKSRIESDFEAKI